MRKLKQPKQPPQLIITRTVVNQRGHYLVELRVGLDPPEALGTITVEPSKDRSTVRRKPTTLYVARDPDGQLIAACLQYVMSTQQLAELLLRNSLTVTTC